MRRENNTDRAKLEKMLSKIENALGLTGYGPKSDSEVRKLQNSNHIENTRCGCYESRYKVSPDMEENDSGYGVWRSIERGVKRFLNDPGEAVTNEWKEIKREAKETGLELAMKCLAHEMSSIDYVYRKCVSNPSVSTNNKGCEEEAKASLLNILDTGASYISSEKQRKTYLGIRNLISAVDYKQIKKTIIDFIRRNEELRQFSNLFNF